MMERLWGDILERFGQEVTLREGEEAVTLHALVQPVLEREGLQEAPSPLGLERRERLRYMGPAEPPLGPDTLVEWKGRDYRVRSACLAGEGVCPHWWAVLYPREEGAL